MGINFQGVSYAYNIPKKKINTIYNLQDINITINDKDEFIAIIGHTGSGKSTLSQLCNALILPTSGSIDIDSYHITKKAKFKLKPIRKKIGLVFQFPEYQIFEETCLKDIAFGPKNFGSTKEEAIELAKEASKLVGLTDELLSRSPFSLSGGEMRKVAISGIIASNPDILILDEPTVGLDPLGKNELLNLLTEYHQEYHKTIIVITHDMEVVSRYTKRTIVLNQGSIVYDGASQELFKNENIIKSYHLDYPRIPKLLMELKEKLSLNIDCFQYTELDALKELTREENNE